MKRLTSMYDSEGQVYDLPDDKVAAFTEKRGGERAFDYRLPDGSEYSIPESKAARFTEVHPDAVPTRRMSFANGTTRDFTFPEISKFLRSKEWREGDEYKADREERDKAVAAKMGDDGEMHSPAWAGVKGALKGAATGTWEGGNAAANKIARAIPEIGVSLESALGNALNLGGNAPNAVGNWFLADARGGKEWLDRNLPAEAKEWTGYEDWSTKTADKFADVFAMAYKFAPAMATGGSSALINTIFASDGINAASQTFDNAMQSGFTPAEANAAAGASFLVNFYGAKALTKAGGVAEGIANPILRFLAGGAATSATMGTQNAANRAIENVSGGRIDETTGLPSHKPRPITDGLLGAFGEGAVEGAMFHGINAMPGLVVNAPKAYEQIRATREAREYLKDSLLETSVNPDGGALLDVLLPREGVDAAIKAREAGKDVSRKLGKDAGLPDNMSALERNSVIDAIIESRKNAPKPKSETSINEAMGGKDAPADAGVIKTPPLVPPTPKTEVKPNETGNMPDEAPAKPEKGAAGEPKAPEVAKPAEGEPPRAEAPREGVVVETGEKAPTTAPKPPEAQSPAEPAKPVPDGKGKMVKPKAVKPKIAKADPKKAAKVVEDFVSKGGTRVTLKRVHHDHENGVAVATDGRVLIATKHGYDSNAKDNPDDPYPNWKQVVPNYDGKTAKIIEREVDSKGRFTNRTVEKPVQRVEVNPAELSDTCKKAARLAKATGNKDTVLVSIPLPDGERVVMDAANLKKVSDAMGANGITEIKAVGGFNTILAKNADTTIVAMPVRDGNSSTGRGSQRLVLDALTGRVIAAPERSDTSVNTSRKWADDLRKTIASQIEQEKTTGEYQKVLEAKNRGIMNPAELYKEAFGGDYEGLSESNKDWLKRFVEAKDADSLAEVMAEYRDRNLGLMKKRRNEIARIEKRIAAEDEIDALMGEVKPEAPKGKGPTKPTDPVAEARDFDNASGTDVSGIISLVSNIAKRLVKNRGVQKHYKLAKTSDVVKSAGLTGDYFTLKTNVITGHYGKDRDHSLTPSEWVAVAKSLDDPLVISRYGNKGGDYRIWVEAKINGRNAVVGVEVKSPGKNIAVNAIRTVFGDEFIDIKPESIVYNRGNGEGLRTLLGDPNYREYSETPQRKNNIPQSGEGVKGGGNAEGSLAEPAKRTVADTIADLDRLIAEEEAGGGASAPAAEGLPASSSSWGPGKGVSRVKEFFGGLVSKNSIVRTIKDTFPEFAIRGKNTTRIGKSYAGHFEPWRELIRSKDMSSIDTIPHEIGHGISMRTKRKMMNIPQEVKRDLARMGRDLYGNKKPNGGYMEEGWAEYMRGYMTGADNLATEAPHLDKWFREKFAPAHPDYVRKIDRIRKEVMRYRLQSDIQRAAAEQRPETSAARRAWDKVMDFFSAENWNDEGATLTRGYKKSGLAEMHEWRPEMRELEKLVKKGQSASPRAQELARSINAKILSDPRIFASNARGTSKARTMDMMKYGITNLTGTEKIGDVTGFDANGRPIRNNSTESYRDIFRDFTKKELADWDLYAAAKIGLENYVKKGKEFGVDKASLERRVAALENPKFLDALDRFTKMSRRALSVGLEAGALTPEQYKKIVGEHKYYVRIERRLAEDGAGGGKGQANPIHKIKGSTKNIMPPRLATMMQIEKQLRYFQTMKVLNMIARDVRKAEVANTEFRKTGAGRDYQIGANLPMEVANAQEAVKFGSEKLRREVTKKMNDTGVTNPNTFVGNKTEADALFDQLFNDGDDMLTVFRERPSNGKNGLVSTYIDGKLVTFELPDAKWTKYITGMESGFDNGPSGKVWDAITAPGKLLRFGATTANPVFAIANAVRDSLHSAIMSDTGAKPLVSSAVGMVNDMLGMDAGRLFKSMGGEMSMLMGSNKEVQFRHMQNAARADNILQQVAADTSLLHPFAGALRVYTDLLSKPEMGPRVREVMGVMKRAQAAGLDRETAAWLAFAAGKDISIDFGKHGKYMKALNQLIPYTNAWYRGLEQFARNMGLTKALPTQFEERQGRRAMRTAGRGLLYLSSVAVANGIAIMLMMDDKERRAEFNKMPREKWEYDDILGTVRVPLPFELGAVFYAVPKAIVYEAFGDKGAVKEAIWHGLSTNLGKYSSVEDFTSGITAIAPFVDMLRNKKWDESPIVSPHIMDAYPKDRQMWYDYSTTEAAKWVGEKMDWAPAHIDHVANTWTGGMWKRLLSPASETTLKTQTGMSTFIPRPTARRDVHDFYDFRSEAQSHYNAGTASIEDVGKLARANKLHEKLSPMFKEARELSATEPNKAERRKKREAIMDKAFDLIHEFNVEETNDRRNGLAKAAVALTNSAEIEKSVRDKNLAVLKDVPLEEVKEALRAYGREKVAKPIRNSAGFKTGRMKTSRRWESETVSRRIRLLKKVLEEQP